MKKKLLSFIMIVLTIAIGVTTLVGCSNMTSGGIKDAYITIDINPSMEIITDSTGKVSSIIALNEDADLLLSDLILIGKTAEEATNIILAEAKAMGYIVDGEQNAVLINVTAEKDADKIEDILSEKVKKFAKESQLNISFLTAEADRTLIDEATTLNITTSKLQLIKLAMQYDSTLTVQVAKDMSIKDLNNIVLKARQNTANLLTQEMRLEYELIKARYEAEEEFAEFDFLYNYIMSAEQTVIEEYLEGMTYDNFISTLTAKYDEIKAIDLTTAVSNITLTQEELDKIDQLANAYYAAREAFDNTRKGNRLAAMIDRQGNGQGGNGQGGYGQGGNSNTQSNNTEFKVLLHARNDAKRALKDYADVLEDKYNIDIEIATPMNGRGYKLIIDADYGDAMEEMAEGLIEKLYQDMEILGADMETMEDLFEEDIEADMEAYESQVEEKLDAYEKTLDANLAAIKDSLCQEKQLLKELAKK